MNKQSDSDEMVAWCGACQLEIKGELNWINHLESAEHKNNVAKFSKPQRIIHSTQKKSNKGAKILIGIVAIFVCFALLSFGNFSQYIEDENLAHFVQRIETINQSLDQTATEIKIDESRTITRETLTGETLAYNPAVIEQLVHQLTNEQREFHGLDAVKFDYKISDIARLHSLDMAENEYFSHENLDGLDASDRAREAGFRCFKMVGNSIYSGLSENIFRGSLYSAVKTLGGVPISYEWLSEEEIAHIAVDGWMNSEGHRKNILDLMFDKEGIGVVISSDDKVYVTQNFC